MDWSEGVSFAPAGGVTPGDYSWDAPTYGPAVPEGYGSTWGNIGATGTAPPVGQGGYLDSATQVPMVLRSIYSPEQWASFSNEQKNAIMAEAVRNGYNFRGAADPVMQAKMKEWGVSQAPDSPWTLPSYFVERPAESVGSPSSLGPMANYYLSQLFPGIAGYMAAEDQGPPAGAYVPPWAGMWEGRKSPSVSAYTTSETTTDTNTGAPIVKEKPGVTVAATPVAPSAQMWGQLQASGALPALQSYVENVLQTPWNEFQNNVQSYWPTRSGARQPASYRTLPQK